MTRRLPLLLALFLLTPVLHAQVTAAARLGPEIVLPEAPPGDALLPSTLGSVVGDGDGYVVFWTRTDPNSIITPIMATRVNADGERVGDTVTIVANSDRVFGLRAAPVPAGGFLLSWAESDGLFAYLIDENLNPRRFAPARIATVGATPAVACNAEQCMIATLRAGVISASLVSPNGQLTGDMVLVTERSQTFSIAAIDRGFVIAYVREQPDLRVRVAAFDNTMRMTGGSTVDAVSTNVIALPNGPYATVVWSHDNEVRGALVTNTGAHTNPRRVLQFKNAVGVAAGATSEAQHLIVVSDHSRDTGINITGSIPATDLYAVRLTRALDPLDRNAFAVNLEPHASLAPSVSSNGRDFLVGWSLAPVMVPTETQGRFVAVRAEGFVGSEQMLRFGPQPQTGVALASGNRGHLAAWMEPTGLHARITGNGDALSEAVRLSDGNARNVSAGTDGNDYAVAWLERGDPAGSAFTRIAIIDGDDATQIRTVEFPALPSSRIVWTGSSYAMLVRAGATMYLVRLAADGAIIEQSPLFQVDNNLRTTAIAASDGQLTIAWSTASTGLWVATGAGSTDLTPRHLSSRAPTSLALASRDDESFLVSSDFVSGGVFATRLDRNGRKLDGVHELGVLLDPGLTQYPVSALAYRDDSWLALWRRGNGTLLGVKFDEGTTNAAFRVEPAGYIAQHFANTDDDEVTILFGRVESGQSVSTRLVLRELEDTDTAPRRRVTMR